MSDDKKHIDELFRTHLKEHRAKAPGDAWQRLHADLHGKKKLFPVWYVRAAAAVVLLLLAFAAGYFLADSGVTDQQQTVSETRQETQMTDSKKETKGVSEIQDKSVSITDAETKPPEDVIALESVKNKRIPIVMAEIPHDKDVKSSVAKQIIPGSLQKKSITSIRIPDLKAPGIPAIVQEEDISEQEEVPVMDADMLQEMLKNENELADDILNRNKKKTSKWSMGAQFSPVYSYRSLGSGEFQTPDESINEEFFEDSENGIVSLAGGISLDYRFSDRLSLGSGLYVSRIGQENSDVLAYNSPDGNGMYKLATSAGTVTINPRKFETVVTEQHVSVKDSIPGDYTVNASMVQNLDYLEVPLIIKLKVLNSKFSMNLMGGLSPGILVNNRSYFKMDDEKLQTGTTENINPIIYNSLFGIGMEYTISKKLSISMEPTFKYSLTPVNSGSDLQYRPYSVSWFTGLSYKLY